MPALIALAYVSLLIMGLIDNIRGPFYPEVLIDMGVNATTGSLFFAVVSGMCFLGALASHWVLKHKSSVYLLMISSAFLSLGFIAVSQAPSMPWMLVACVFFGFAFGANNLSQNTLVVESAPPRWRRRFLSGLHSMYGIAAMLAPLCATLFRHYGLNWRQSFFVLALLPAAAAVFAANRLRQKKWISASTPAVSLNRAEWLSLASFCVFIAGYLYAEVSVSTRLVLWLRKDRLFEPDIANYYLAGFFSTLLLGRLAFSFFDFSKYSNKAVLQLSSLLSGLFYLCGLHYHPGFFVPMGFTMAPFYPAAMDLLSHQFGSKANQAIGFVMGFGSLSMLVMHLGLGWLDDIWGLTNALQLCAFALLIVFLILNFQGLKEVKVKMSRHAAIPSFFRIVSYRFLLLLFAYFLTRVLYLVWNWPAYENLAASDIAKAFVYGMRFDTSAIVLTNIPWILLWMLPLMYRRQKWFRFVDLSLFALINYAALGLNIVDAEFVKFIGKRMAIELLRIRDDVERHSLSILWTYWYFTLLSIGLAVVLTLIVRKWRDQDTKDSWAGAILWRLALVFLLVTGARGGYQVKPLHPMHAYFSTQQELGVLTLNTPFNLIKSRSRGRIETNRYFATDAEAIAKLNEMTKLTRPPLAVAKNWNVVLIIVESFSAEYSGLDNTYPGYSPFFDSLAKDSFYFKYNFANARRSIEGLPAVLCGLPALMDEPIITSDFSNNRFDCLPKILGRQGYSTYFLHGAHNGSMHFDTFSKIAGFENFVGLNEYPKNDPGDLDPHWGVLDEPMLQYAIKLMDQSKRPTMMSVFTLSSHHPYFIPPQHRGKFKKGTLEIHESIGYADYALKKFFETAKTKPWFNETIFVITGDHIQKSDQSRYANLLGYYRVPLLIYTPGLKKGQAEASPERITQQIDILPSVLDLLGTANPDRLLVGQSVFDEGQPGRAYNYTSHSYWYLDSKVLLEYRHAQNESLVFSHTNTYDVKPSDDSAGVQLDSLKAIVHYINQGLVGNSLYRWRQ